MWLKKARPAGPFFALVLHRRRDAHTSAAITRTYKFNQADAPIIYENSDKTPLGTIEPIRPFLGLKRRVEYLDILFSHLGKNFLDKCHLSKIRCYL